MTKVKLCRASGQPVKIEHLDLFRNDYRTLYDRVVDKFVAKGQHLDMAVAQRMDKLLARLEKKLHKVYPNVEYVDYPQTETEWMSMVQQYGPVMVAINRDDQSLALVIYDLDLGA